MSKFIDKVNAPLYTKYDIKCVKMAKEENVKKSATNRVFALFPLLSRATDFLLFF